MTSRDMQQTYGPITVVLRVGTRDYYAYLTDSAPRIGVIGRSLYEAVGDLVTHHPEQFVAAAAANADLLAALATIAEHEPVETTDGFCCGCEDVQGVAADAIARARGEQP